MKTKCSSRMKALLLVLAMVLSMFLSLIHI